MDRLEAAYKNGHHEAAFWLGKCYELGTDHVDRDAVNAKNWYWIYYEHGHIEGLKKWMEMQLDIITIILATPLPHTSSFVVILANMIKKKLLEERAKYPTASEFPYYLGELNRRCLNNIDEAISEYELAARLNPACANSRKNLYQCYSDLASQAASPQKEAYQQEADYWQLEIGRAGESIIWKDKAKVEPELLDAIKDAVTTDSQTWSSRSFLFNYYKREHANATCERASNVALIWLAFVAQCGHNDAGAYVVKHGQNAFGCFASGLIYLYGVPNSACNYDADHEKALEFFRKSYQANPTIFEDYIKLVDSERPHLMSKGLRHELQKLWEMEVAPKKEGEALKLKV